MPPETSTVSGIEELIAAMTLEEKVSLSAGSDIWRSTGVPRLGIPGFKVSDGPNGVRGESRQRGMTSACFPVGSCMAATWNRDLMRRTGEALAEECDSKNVQVLLGPTVNLHRSPLAGRNFECFSEDPYLTAEIAHEWVAGVQSRGVACCIKHFVCNDSEFQRHSMSSEVDTRTLHEIYLPPFEKTVRKTVRDTQVWSVMSAYNKVNGISASANGDLLTQLLKQRWQFDGVVISDWHGTYATLEPALAGLDLEMPGPGEWLGSKLLAAVQAGDVPEALIDDKVRRQLRLMLRTGVLSLDASPAFTVSSQPDPEVVQPQERAIDRPEHRALIRQVAAEGMVLLKNEAMLPLENPATLALIGPNAVEPRIMGGGSSFVSPHYSVTPLEGLQAALPDCEVTLYQGCFNFRYLPLLPPATARVPGEDRSGMQVSFFDNLAFEGEPVLVTHPRRSLFTWFGSFDESVGRDFSARVRTELTVQQSGVHYFSLISAGLSRMNINGKLLIDNWSDQKPGPTFFDNGSSEVRGDIHLNAGDTIQLEVDYSRAGNPGLAGLRIGMFSPQPEDLMQQAVAGAARADAAVVMIGLDPDWESEGFDRTDLSLPGKQAELISAVSAANPNTLVVVNAGAVVEMSNWLARVPALLQAWYPGQEFGHALADIITGRVNPSGRLPTTFPKRLEDNPAYINYPGENGEVRYGEGIFVGYRYYEEKHIEPLFPFGHGLSYTQFEYENLQPECQEYACMDIQGGASIDLAFDLTNSGARAGSEVVQLYISDSICRLRRPQKELKGFQKIALDPGETRRVEFSLTARDFSFFDPGCDDWVLEAGEFVILIASSSRNIQLQRTITIV